MTSLASTAYQGSPSEVFNNLPSGLEIIIDPSGSAESPDANLDDVVHTSTSDPAAHSPVGHAVEASTRTS